MKPTSDRQPLSDPVRSIRRGVGVFGNNAAGITVCKAMDGLIHNIRYAGRRLAQKPGFTLVAVFSLALGIGANTAIFNLVNAVLIRDLPLEKPEELVEIYLSTPDFEYGVFSWPDYEDLAEGTTEVFTDVIATRILGVQFDSDDGVEMVPGEAVTGNYFAVLGIEAELGRVLLPEDDIAPGGHPVVMLGYSYWQSAYGGDPGVVGQSIRIGGLPYTIVGVAPKAYPGHFRGVRAAIFAPRMMVHELMQGSSNDLETRGNHSVFVSARRRPGVSLVRAETAAEAVAARLRDDNIEDWDPQATFVFVPTTDVILFPPVDKFVRATAWVLTGVVGLVLLMACVNLASFLLARALDRKKEIALRLALGATRRNLIGQLLTETLMLACLGGVAGLGVSIGLLEVLIGADLPLPLPITLDLTPDWNVLGFSFAISILAGLFLGLAPALQSTNPDMSATIKDESAGVGRSGALTLRNMLVVAQVATSLVLLVGAGLFLRSLERAQTVDPGFGRDPAAILSVVVPSTRYSKEEGRAFADRMLVRFLEIPGVEAAGLTSNLHLNTMSTQNISINVDGVEPPREREAYLLDRATVSPGFFDAAGVRILRGRNFDERDRPDGTHVAIINEALADKFFAGRNALGGILRRPDSEDEDLLVIGIASNAKIRSLGEAPREFVYQPYSQSYTSFVTVVAKTRDDPQRTALELMQTARELDSELMVWEAKSMDRHLGIVLLPARLSAIVFSAFATIALVLASIGLYGIVSYSVSQRTREVGIRMSLGANSRDIVRMLMSGGLKLVAVGGALGIVGALAVTPVLGSLLFGVDGRDVVAFTTMPLILMIVATLAALLPALRASRIEPVRALHTE